MTATKRETETAGRAQMPGLVLGPGFVLGIDTCGPAGSVALARCDGERVEILGQRELAGRSYSATLVMAVGELLQEAGAGVASLRAIVVVNGPGSFTGVRVGVSAAKGLVEGREIGVAPVSRLQVLAAKSGTGCAALDAHRHEVFLRVEDGRELLAGKDELAAYGDSALRVAVCDDAAEVMLRENWAAAELIRVEPPTAADAIALCAARVAAGDFADPALLDGHYLRRSDAEIFGPPGAQKGA